MVTEKDNPMNIASEMFLVDGYLPQQNIEIKIDIGLLEITLEGINNPSGNIDDTSLVANLSCSELKYC